ncbi:MAG: hypothetical protein AAF710_03045 [Planctomycetota bacterium]
MPDATPPTPDTHPTLCPEDAAVFDALLEARRREAQSGPMPPASGERVESMQGVMRLLDTARVEDGGEALIQATLARVAATPVGRPVEVTPLCAADSEALDAVLAAGGEAGPVPPGTSPRAERVRGVLSVLAKLPGNDAPPAADEALVRRTLDAAAEQRQRQQFAAQIEMFSGPRRTIGVSWRQVFTAAAVLLLGVSVLVPAIENSRQSAQQVACATNLGIAGQQIGQYAMDHGHALPRGPVGASWLMAGRPEAVDDRGRFQSNSAHLYLLIREGYVAPSRLACASNRRASIAMPGSGQLDWASPPAISYSYQNQHADRPVRVDLARPGLAVLADKSPVFVVRNDRLVFNRHARRNDPSVLHGGRGQNVLTLDGRVRWTTDPRLGDDNIFHLAGHRGAYTGTETPADAQTDSFLVP